MGGAARVYLFRVGLKMLEPIPVGMILVVLNRIGLEAIGSAEKVTQMICSMDGSLSDRAAVAAKLYLKFSEPLFNCFDVGIQIFFQD